MKATVDTYILQQVTSKASSVLGKASSGWSTMRFCFASKKEGGSYILASNGVASAKIPFKHITLRKSAFPSEFGVPGKAFTNLVAAIDAEEVELSITSAYLTVATEMAKFKIATEDWMLKDLEILTPETWHTIPVDSFVAGLSRAVRVLDRNAFNTTSGVYLVDTGKGLDIVGTDRKRMSLCTIPDVKTGLDHIVDYDGAKLLSSMLKGVTEFAIGSTVDHVILKADGVILSSRVLDGKYADYQRQFEPLPGLTATLQVELEPLKRAIKLAKITAPTKNSSLELIGDDGQLRICSNTQSPPENSEIVIPYTGTQKRFRVRMGASYMLDAVTLFGSGSHIDMLFHDYEPEAEAAHSEQDATPLYKQCVFAVGEAGKYAVMPRTE